MPGTHQNTSIVRTFEGVFTREVKLNLLGAGCEARTIDTSPEGRSALLSPNHTLLTTLAGGHERVSVSVDRKPAYTGPKLPGSGAFFPAGVTVESVWPSASLTYLLVSIPHDVLETFAERPLPRDEWRAQASLADAFLRPALTELGRWLQARTGDGELLFGESLLSAIQHVLLDRVANLPDRAPPERALTANAIDYVEAHLAGPITLAELCAATGVSRSRITRLFRRETGMAPHRFVMHRRMLRAKDLLATTDLPISAIATLVGCANGAHLTRMFQSFFTVSPRAWRHSVGS